ncbi:MAG: DsbA family protein [bacterium]
MTHSLTRRHALSLSGGFVAVAATGAFADTTTPAPADPAATDAATPTPAAATPIADYGIGDMAAKVKIVEYLSFTCPHCMHFHRDIYPSLKADYIDTGKVRLEYHEVYFDQLGLLGAMMARCGGEMRYMGITDMLYDKQMDWAGAADINAAVAALKKIGLAAGMDDATLDTCLHDQDMAKALVAHYQDSLNKDYPNDSFKGTPSFIINGTQYANMSYDDLKAILDAELAK